MPIKFGTDGWRAVIAEEFTFDNVRLCAQGTADYMRETGAAERGLVVGYDTRFASEEFAAAVAEVATANGIKTTLADRAAPTPTFSFAVTNGGFGGGVVITASHNPGQWNGYKYKSGYGGSAATETVDELEAAIAKVEAHRQVKRMPLKEAAAKGLLTRFDPQPPYLAHVAKLVDMDAITRAGLKVIADPMYGAGMGYFPALLSGGATKVTELHGQRNPLFPGMVQPEPLAHNLAELMAAVPKQSADAGLANDADADRLGVVDERGRFVTTLEAFSLLCLHQLEVLGKRGPLVRSITMSSMIDRLGEIYGVKVFVEPVGFKYLGPLMVSEKALAAGEESGGYAFRGHITERDGVFSGLLLLEMMVKTGKRVSELLDMLVSKVGPHFYDRVDLAYDAKQREAILARVKAARPAAMAGLKVASVDSRDGYRFVFQGGYWALVRFSGTEPLLRTYAEADSPERVEKLLHEVRALAGV